MKFKDAYDEKEGILRVDVLDTFDGETTFEFFTSMNEKYTPEQQRYCLIYMAEAAQRLVDKEVRRVAREKGALLKWDKLAIWGAKPGLRMVAKIVLTAIGKGNDTQFFENEQEAFSWLKTQQNKDNNK